MENITTNKNNSKNSYEQHLADNEHLGEMFGGFAQAFSQENLQKAFGQETKNEEPDIVPVENIPVKNEESLDGLAVQQKEKPVSHEIIKTEELQKEKVVEIKEISRSIDIGTQITEETKKIEETKEQINILRNTLNLPPTDEIPPSMELTKAKIENLKKEEEKIISKEAVPEVKNEILQENREPLIQPEEVTSEELEKAEEYNNPEEREAQGDQVQTQKEWRKTFERQKSLESNEESKIFERNIKTALEEITSSSRTMMDALYERQQNRLIPLQSEDAFYSMASQLKQLGSFEGKIDKDSISEIISKYRNIANMLSEFGPRGGGTIVEDTRNLEKLIHGVRKFSSVAEDWGRRFPVEMKDPELQEKSIELRKVLQNLSSNSQRFQSLAIRMREKFERYSRF